MSTFPKHMMATSANHKLGDLSREKESLARIEREDPETGMLIGAWSEGHGFFNVEFDPETARELTPEEVLSHEQKVQMMNGTSYGLLKIDGYDDVVRPEAAKPIIAGDPEFDTFDPDMAISEGHEDLSPYGPYEL